MTHQQISPSALNHLATLEAQVHSRKAQEARAQLQGDARMAALVARTSLEAAEDRFLAEYGPLWSLYEVPSAEISQLLQAVQDTSAQYRALIAQHGYH